MSWINRLFFPARYKAAMSAQNLHAAILSEARAPHLFGDLRIPDTMDGRVDAIALFAGMVSARLVSHGVQGRRVTEALNARLFDSFDAGLRETGVGDASIARKIRKIGERFVGLGVAMTEAIHGPDPLADSTEVLIRNDITARQGAPLVAERLVEAWAVLRSGSDEAIISGKTGWGLYMDS